MKNFSCFTYNIVQKFGYLALFIIFSIEGLGLPLPVQLLFLVVAYFIELEKMSLIRVVIIVTIGNLLGNIVAYYIGFYGRKPIIDKFSRILHIRSEDIYKVEKWFQKYGSLTNMVSRWIGITRTPAIWASGIFNINIYYYIIFSFLGDLIWALVSIFLYLEIYSSIEIIVALPIKYKILIILSVAFVIILVWQIFFKYFYKTRG